MNAKQIFQLLLDEEIKSKRGNLTFSLAGIEFPVESRDIVGGVLQEWFEKFLLSKQIFVAKPSNTQDWPDFILSNGDHLEIKAFNHDASPGFDIANFDAYTRSLIHHPERLDTEHIIFSYVSNAAGISVIDFWLKKAWQMTGPSAKNFLNLQVKQDVPVNIRPKDWRGAGELFTNRKDFVIALGEAMNHFHPERYQNPDWAEMVSSAYLRTTGQQL